MITLVPTYVGSVTLREWDGMVDGEPFFKPHIRVSVEGLLEDVVAWHDLQIPLYQIQENLEYANGCLPRGRTRFIDAIRPIIQDIPDCPNSFDVFLIMFHAGSKCYPTFDLAKLVEGNSFKSYEVCHE